VGSEPKVESKGRGKSGVGLSTLTKRLSGVV
jgi:hypothetical protein